MGAGLVRGPGCDAPTLQAVSTRCALAGSVVAVLDALTQEPVVSQPSRLELAAVALITASLLLEAETFRRRCRCTGAKARGCHGRQCSPQLERAATGATASTDTAASGPVGRPWPQLLVLLGLASLVMGGFTALGAGAARRLGIVPRTWGGLPGVVFGCFVHLSWRHCGWNALALLLLGPCVLRAAPSAETLGARGEGGSGARSGIGGVAPFMAASAFISVTSGFCVWCLARPAIHAGASGIVCGYVGLLLALTLRQRDVPLGSLLMVLGVVVCYGSVVLLSRPMAGGCPRGDCFNGRLSLYEACTSRTTSAEQHTFGFLSGLASALFFCQPRLPTQRATSLPKLPGRAPSGDSGKRE
uniref:Peptidase S54 rhomboid domain-containing protein n=1 Tax=Pyrodinium bahamense TaxID=73915 RepID=A0A7S0AMB4_9DINO|mmetsp:Transcript_37458/g.104069  ORF Transcript_37458/g.104069 Transcript_37458/m.104069 type:complete len:358 (+) Transcript_37458:74-1147(+)